MGDLLQKLGSGASKVGKGLSNIDKGISKAGKNITGSITTGGKNIIKGLGKVTETRIGKAVIVGAAIYTGYALISGLAEGTLATSSPIIYGALTGSAAGAMTGAVATNDWAGVGQGALLGGAVGAGAAYMSAPTAGAPAQPGAPGGQSLIPRSSSEAAFAAGTSVPPTVPASMPPVGSSFAADNPMLTYGLVQGGLGLAQGYAQGNAAQEAVDSATRTEQAQFDRSQVSNVPGYRQQLGLSRQQGTAQVLSPQSLLPQVDPAAPPQGQTLWAQR